MGVDRFRRAPKVDLETEHLDGRALQAVDAILRGRSKGWRLALQLPDFVDSERHHEQNQAGKRDDDDHEHHDDGQDSRQPDVRQANDAGLDEERDCRPQHEGAEEVAQQVKDNNRDREGPEGERDLQVPAPSLRIDGPSGYAGSA